MQKYEKLKKLGSGSFGNVELAQNKQTKQIVAIKQLKKKYGTWQQCLQMSEVKALRKMAHPNVIKLKQMVRIGNDAHLVFEYIQKDLFKLMTQRKQKGNKLTDNQIRHITRQMVQALAYIHKQGFFHRDLKPENVLIDKDFNAKLIDFGIAKQIRSKPPFTEYVSTRWYRAPQILFKFSAYSAPVDIFALGCIIAQMYLLKPLFLGNSQMDQISKITSILGTPKHWTQGMKQANKRGINIPEYGAINLNTIIEGCPADGVDFITQCLRWQPSKRMSATQLLQHPFIAKVQNKIAKQQKIIQSQQGINSNSSKYVIGNSSPTKKVSNIKKQEYTYKGIQNDELFQQLLNNFDNCKVVSKKQIKQKEDDDQWN